MKIALAAPTDGALSGSIRLGAAVNGFLLLVRQLAAGKTLGKLALASTAQLGCLEAHLGA